MSNYVETLSYTELMSRKIFLENQLNIVNDLINEKNKFPIVNVTNTSSFINENEYINDSSIKNNSKKIKIKIKQFS